MVTVAEVAAVPEPGSVLTAVACFLSMHRMLPLFEAPESPIAALKIATFPESSGKWLHKTRFAFVYCGLPSDYCLETTAW